ncbi:MAG: methionyl-tRNA formyltransferase [Pseudomonadota bacterium]
MTKPLRIAFMGSPDFSVPVLAALVEAGHEIACVYSQPPRPAGRGKKLRPTPVHQWAEENGFEVRTPRSLKKPDQQEAFAELELDAAVVVAYGLILPQAILDAPRLGSMNMHASLLPRWRGAAPIHRAVMAGDEITGVQAMMMEAGLDTGPILATEKTRIFSFDTTQTVHDRLAGLAADLAVRALAGLADGSMIPQPQSDDGVVYAHKVSSDDQRIDWTCPAAEIDRQIRGLSPFPGAWCHFTPAGEDTPLRMKVLMSRLDDSKAPSAQPGEVIDDALLVRCGDGACIRVLRAQKPGSKAMDAETLLRGLPMPAGSHFE